MKFVFVLILSILIGIGASVNLKLALLILGAVISGIIAMYIINRFNADNIILGTIFLFPLMPFHMGIDLGGFLPVIRIHRVLTAFILIVWFIKGRKKRNDDFVFPLGVVFWITFICMTISSILSYSLLSSLFRSFSFALEYFLLATIIFYQAKNLEFRDKIYSVIAVSSGIAALIGICEYITGFNIYSFIKPFRSEVSYALIQQLRGEGSLRIKGSFDHAISFGVFLVVSNIAALYLYSIRKKLSSKVLYCAIVVINTLAVFLTQSRTAIVFLIIVIGPILLLRRRKELFVAIGIALFLMLVGAFINLDSLDNIYELFEAALFPFKSGTTEMMSSANARVLQYYSLIDFIKDRPFLGYGRLDLGFKTVDNFYMLFTVQYGLITAISFIIIFIIILKNNIWMVINSRNEHRVLIGLFGFFLIIGYMVALWVVSLESYFFLIFIYLGLFCRNYCEERGLKCRGNLLN